MTALRENRTPTTVGQPDLTVLTAAISASRQGQLASAPANECTRRFPTEAAEREQPGEPPRKFLKLTQKLASDNNQVNVVNGVESELAKYFILIKDRCPNIENGIAFWIANKSSLPELAPIALDLCSSPASEAFCERIFSVCGDFCSGKRNRTSKSLERKVFLKLNQKFVL